jgi:hypothetical protein
MQNYNQFSYENCGIKTLNVIINNNLYAQT